MTFVDWLMSPQAGTVLIGLVAAGIAWQNLRATRNKLKFDMFERRLHTYQAIEQIFTSAGHFGTLTREQLSQLETETAQAAFLFSNAEIDALLRDAVNNGHIVERYCSAFAFADEGGLPEDLEQFKRDRRDDLLHKEIYGAPFTPPPRAGRAYPPPDSWVEATNWFSKNWAVWNKLTLRYLRLRH